MAIEIEIKLKVEDHEQVRRRLLDLGATRAGETFETNLFFDTAGQTLRRSDRGLRIRVNHDPQSGSDTYVVTYKGPRAAGPVKSREELEICVDHLNCAVALFERLGYTQTLKFEKRRETWRLDRCTVVLDQLPQLGCFVEVEGPSQEVVLEARDQIGLSAAQTMTASYAEMISQHLDKETPNLTTLAFS